jgi:hypothetical protein
VRGFPSLGLLAFVTALTVLSCCFIDRSNDKKSGGRVQRE